MFLCPARESMQETCPSDIYMFWTVFQDIDVKSNWRASPAYAAAGVCLQNAWNRAPESFDEPARRIVEEE